MTLTNLISDILKYIAENDRADLLSRPVLSIDIDKTDIYIYTDKETVRID